MVEHTAHNGQVVGSTPTQPNENDYRQLFKIPAIQ